MDMNSYAQSFLVVRQRIELAAVNSGREPSQIKLLAVSKTFPAEAVIKLAELGQIDFGENYISEAVEKIQTINQSASMQRICDVNELIWHCIGPVQSNKTRLLAENFHWVHSVDRLKIAERLSQQRPSNLPPLQICIQINIDGGLTKSGVAPDQALELAEHIQSLSNLQLRGIMTIPEPVKSYAEQLKIHLKAKRLFDDLKSQLKLPGFDTLSMGMSADLESAIEAGSTLVRVGSALFGKRT
jgi:hypothetical protein